MASAPQDPRHPLISTIDIGTSRVEFSDSPIVLLCGGAVKEKDRPEDVDPPIRSLRHAITRTHTAYEIFRPEEITSWHFDGIFKNLMTFEADLASICSLVVIILESAGSLAELGAFSQLSDLSKKIIAIKSSKFNNDLSFINLGILRFISERHQSSVKIYPWDIGNPNSISAELISDVISDIGYELSVLPRSQVLKPSQGSHIVVLICEVIKLFSALKEQELLGYLSSLGVEITKDELKRKLFLLEEFRLIRKETYSDSTFYLRSNEAYHRLRLALKEGAILDAFRFNIECLEYYNSDSKHRNRVRAITQASQRAGR